MCDITRPMRETESQRLDREIAEYERDWFSVARYRVVRSKFDQSTHRKQRRILATGLTYPAAKELQSLTDAAIRQEPDYRELCMGNAMALVELENHDSAWIAFKEIRQKREFDEKRSAA